MTSETSRWNLEPDGNKDIGAPASVRSAEFWQQRPLIGMVHLGALPGSPRDTGVPLSTVIERAVADARALEEGGADAIMVENFFDAPFAKDRVPPHTLAAMTRAVQAVREVTRLPLGVNVLRNDALSALAIAHICGAQFVRINVYIGAAVTDQGLIEGAARAAILYRRELRAETSVAIWADIFVKHAAQLGAHNDAKSDPHALADAARDAVLRGMADALIVSGTATGHATDPNDVRHVKAAVPNTPVLVGSGFDIETAPSLLAHADGAIVGTSLKRDGNVAHPVDVERVRALKRVCSTGNRE